jgi:hypothetical protein
MQSSTIITMNPAMMPKVASLSKPFLWLSGMISSLTTKIIAPAAKARAHGKIELNMDTNATPNIPPTGSTNPVKVPYQRDLRLLYPSLSKGKATARPSGMF